MIILDHDSHSQSCTVWGFGKVGVIKGDHREICESIKRRVFHNGEQVLEIAIDVGGDGRYMCETLRNIGLEVQEIVPKDINAFLPVLDRR